MSGVVHAAAHVRRGGRWSTAALTLARQMLGSRTSRAPQASGRQKAAFYRALWTDAAASIGAGVRDLPDGELEIEIEGGAIRLRGMHCLIDDMEVLRATADKPGVSSTLAAAGLSVPPHRVFALESFAGACRFLAEAPGACVVKPAYAGGGSGVTTGVRDPQQLRRAAAVAAAAGARAAMDGKLRMVAPMFVRLATVPLLIEHQFAGTDYRLLYLDNVLLDAVRREPPSVTGDGRATISALIDRVNHGRLDAEGRSAQPLISRDLELARTLAAQGLTPASVPPAGSQVRLKTAINENSLRDNKPARAGLCESVVADGARAVSLLGARFAGVDIVTTDPGVPLAESGGGILEVNIPPGLAMHYHGHPGAVEPATMLLRHLSGTREWESA